MVPGRGLESTNDHRKRGRGASASTKLPSTRVPAYLFVIVCGDQDEGQLKRGGSLAPSTPAPADVARRDQHAPSNAPS